MLQNDGPVQLNWPFSLGRTPERKRGQAMGSGSVEQANSMLSIERGDAIPSARGSVEQANSMLSVERGEAIPPARDMLTTGVLLHRTREKKIFRVIVRAIAMASPSPM